MADKNKGGNNTDIERLMDDLFRGGTLRTGGKAVKKGDDIVLTTKPDTGLATGHTYPGKGRNLDTDTLLKMNDEVMAQINELNRQLARDEERLAVADGGDKGEKEEKKRAKAEEMGPEEISAAFKKVQTELAGEVVGQQAFRDSLLVAFRRPFVMGVEANHARNCMLVRGQKGTGKHTAVYKIADAMGAAGLLAAPGVDYIDLALYPNAEDSKLFIQDLYRALETPEVVVVFDNFNRCHPSLLSMIASLVQNGRLPLASRYVLQKGMLIEAGTALTPNTISALTLDGQYLVFITEAKISKVADAFGAPFLNALGDTCETGPFTPEELLIIANKQLTALREKARKNLGFTLTLAPEVAALVSGRYNTDIGVNAMEQYCATCYKALSEYKLRHEAAGLTVPLTAEGLVLLAAFEGGEPTPLLDILPGGYRGDIDDVKAEMDKIVGLTEIKSYILSLEENYKVQQLRKAQGMQTAATSMHMIFTGNPGTGKTTIARLVAKYLKAIGVLTGGQLVEVSRADLVGRYVGHTAPLTNQVIKSAIGGVLFIDEAYSLYRGKDDSFGLEAIDTLVKGMEDNRADLVVILAGYSKEMVEFLTANSGLKSRFPNIIEFPDYTGEELLAIARINAAGQGYRMAEDCDVPLLAYFNRVQRLNARDSGNGRLARNKVEDAILNQSRRMIAEGPSELDLLIARDFDLSDG